MSNYVYNKKLGEWVVETPVSVPITSLASIAQNKILGRISGGTGPVEELNSANVKTILDITGVTSSVITSISGDISNLYSTKLDSSAYVQHFKGVFTTLGALTTAFPTASAGDYAQVDPGTGTDLETYSYDLGDGWVKSNAPGSGAANTDALPEGSTNLYFTVSRVRSTVLTGLSLSTNQPIASTDTALQAFGYLQKQVTDLGTSKQDTLVSATNIKTVNGNSLLGAGDLTISGGGSLTYFSENADTSTPNTTVPVHYFSIVNAATDVDVAILSKGAGSFALQVADNTATNGNKRGARAVDLQKLRAAADQVASGIDSFLAGSGNTASGNNSTVTGGSDNQATSSKSTITGGLNNIASAQYSTVAGGRNNTSDGYSSFVCGHYGHAFGVTKFVYGTSIDATRGNFQKGLIVLGGQTINATPKVLTTDGAAAAGNNQLILQNNQAMTFTGMVTAKRSASTSMASWKIEGCIVRNTTAGSTSLPVAATVTAISNTPGWTLAVAADTGNGGLKLTFTGAAATTISINATIETCEVIMV